MGDVDVDSLRSNPQMVLNTKVLFAALDKVDYEKLEPISNALLSCCYRINGNMEEQCTPETVNGYIESFKTLFTLKKEAFAISIDFFGDDGNSRPTTSKPTIEIGKNTKM